MGQSTPLRTNVEADVAEALGWARIAGLVEIHPNGSWSLTPQGLAGALELLDQVQPFDVRPAGQDRGQYRYQA